MEPLAALQSLAGLLARLRFGFWHAIAARFFSTEPLAQGFRKGAWAKRRM